MTFQDEIQSAIQAHAMWKINLLKAIEEAASELDPEKVRVDNQCTFGKWLFGETIPDEAKNMPEYAVCSALHRDFHMNTARVLQLALRGERKEALTALGAGSVYFELSAALIQHLKLWQAKWAASREGRP